MKRPISFFHLFALLAAVFFYTHVEAQVPDSIAITTDGSWIIEHSETVYGYNPQTGTYEYTTTYSYKYYRSGGDTLIAGNTYTKMLVLPINPSNGGFTSYPQLSESYEFAYRNDMNRRAYKVDYGSTTENLWYDFNPGLGDTLWNPITIMPTPYFVVSEIDSAEFCGTKYESFKYENYPYPNTQRVGRFINFINSYQDQFIMDRIHTFCEASVPFESIANVNEIEDDRSFQLYPNPVQDIIHLSLDPEVTRKHVVIYDLMGKVMLSEDLDSGSVSIEHFAAGQYLVTVTTDQGTYTEKLIKR